MGGFQKSMELDTEMSRSIRETIFQNSQARLVVAHHDNWIQVVACGRDLGENVLQLAGVSPSLGGYELGFHSTLCNERLFVRAPHYLTSRPISAIPRSIRCDRVTGVVCISVCNDLGSTGELSHELQAFSFRRDK
jgi:hypothetical protein